VTGTAIGLGLASNVATRLLVDLKKERRMKKEVAEFDKELKDAVAKKDKQKEEKLKKKKPQVDQMRLKASTGRLKVTLITWVPFILLYYFMASQVGGYGSPVVCSPIPIPYITSVDPTVCNYIINGVKVNLPHMPLLWWYFISSLSFGTLVSKILGTQPS
jgi:uncharacterized membrane protein (DUF106 family)